MRVLFIGNSFTYYHDVNKIFESIAENRSVNAVTCAVTNGGAFLAEYADEKHAYGIQLDAALNARDDYDVVVLQEQSLRPVDNYSAFRDGAFCLVKKINAAEPRAKIQLYATWGYPTLAREARYGGSVPEMEQKLRAAYMELQKELHEKLNIPAGISHVGKAFSKVYAENPGINLYEPEPDNKHPSYAGSYLSACVHAAAILGLDLREITFDGELSAQTAAALRAAAHTTVFNSTAA